MPNNDPVKDVSSYLRQEPDESLRAQAIELLKKFENDALDIGLIRERFSETLRFGTAGLRGKMEAGFNRLNRVTVAKAGYAIGLNERLCQNGVVIGYDARLNSQIFATEISSVMRGLGVTVFNFNEPVATPICAYAIRHMKASSAVMVTASHNPRDDNGLKVYGANGAQITKEDIDIIEKNLSDAPEYQKIPRLKYQNDENKKISLDELLSSYIREVEQTRINDDARRDRLRVVYTPLHGVGYRFLASVLADNDKVELIPVKSQVKPDGEFPTLRFPNPEEEGVLDLALIEAKNENADIIIAHDPDADRLAAAFPVQSNSKFRMLTGNEMGAILGSDILENYPIEKKKLVISTLVSSRQLSFIAQSNGASYGESLTGFSKIAQIAISREQEYGEKFVFGFEEALGYSVSGILLDKDGISAAVRLLDRVALLKADRKTIWDELDRIDLQYGLFRNLQWSIRIDAVPFSKNIESVMSMLRTLKRGDEFFESALISDKHDLLANKYRDHPNTNTLIFDLDDGTRVIVRPSGTEPKVKFYAEKMSHTVTPENLEAQREKFDKELNSLKHKIDEKMRIYTCK